MRSSPLTAIRRAMAMSATSALAGCNSHRRAVATAAVADIATAIRIATRGLDGIRETWS